MKTFLMWLALVTTAPAAQVEIPLADRQPGWCQSCAYAAVVSDLQYFHRPRQAQWVRQTKSGGATLFDVCALLNTLHVPYYWVDNGNPAILDSALAAHRPAVIQFNETRLPNGQTFSGPHAVLLVHLDSKRAAILDCNDPQNLHWYTRAAFVTEWRASSGWAVVVTLPVSH